MKLSTRTRYGMRFMIDLAERYNSGCIAMKDVAERQGISKKYLEQVVSPLAQAGLLDVTRGQRGGFRLARPPHEITLAEVVDASERGIELLECLGCPSTCAREDGCASRTVWDGLQNAITDYLESHTLADVTGSDDAAQESCR